MKREMFNYRVHKGPKLSNIRNYNPHFEHFSKYIFWAASFRSAGCKTVNIIIPHVNYKW